MLSSSAKCPTWQACTCICICLLYVNLPSPDCTLRSACVQGAARRQSKIACDKRKHSLPILSASHRFRFPPLVRSGAKRQARFAICSEFHFVARARAFRVSPGIGPGLTSSVFASQRARIDSGETEFLFRGTAGVCGCIAPRPLTRKSPRRRNSNNDPRARPETPRHCQDGRAQTRRPCERAACPAGSRKAMKFVDVPSLAR